MKSRIVFGVLTGGKGANLRQSFKCCLSSRLYSSITTASSNLKVVNHASTINVFSCKNSQLKLPLNFISQIDSGSIALSLQYHFCNESHVPGRHFRR